MTVWGLIQELMQCDDPNKQVKVDVVGEQVHCFNHRVDTDDVVDFEKEAPVLDVVDRGNAVYIEVDL
jgi:hypothetical protein